MKTFTRLLAVLLVLVMALGMVGMTAMAADTITGTTGSITIHKYELNGTAGNHAPGTELSANQIPAGATALSGVTFQIYKIVDAAQLKAYFDGTADNGTEAKISAVMTNWAGVMGQYVTKAGDGSYTVKNISGGTVTASSKTTDANGVAAFTGLSLGLYVVIETDAPDKVFKTADPFLVSVPMTVNDEWLYDVHVYPKNSTSEGNVTLKKTDSQGTALEGVTFSLEKQSGSNWSVVGTNQTTPASGEVTWSSLAVGNYRITEISAPEGYIVDPRPIAFVVNENNTISCADTRTLLTVSPFDATTKTLNMTLINEKPVVTKEITEGQDASAVGEAVKYEATVTVPENISLMKVFNLFDNPTGLYIKPDSVHVTHNGTDLVTTNSYVVTGQADGGFKLEFQIPTMAPYAGETLTVTYNAVITADAAQEDKATNKIKLTYSNKLNADGTSETDVEVKSNVYTANIAKKLGSESGNAGAGVKFQMYADSSLTTPLKFTYNAEKGIYVLDPDNNTAVTELVTNASGNLSIHGLGKKTYYLVETETVDGYNLLSGPVAMDMTTATNFVYAQTIVNKAGFNLPATGGLGTLMFILLGGVLMAGGICLVTTTKKRGV